VGDEVAAIVAKNDPMNAENSPLKPLVSIIVPSFNQGKFIRETIESCLSQDYRPIEILVMDGGSKDQTVAVLKSFDAPELQWWSEPDRGVVDAVNKGLERAKGEVLTIQSSDDVFLPGAISAAVEALARAPDAGLVYGDVELIDEHSTQIGADKLGEFDLAAYLGRFQYVPQPGTCFTRAALAAVGGWREHISYAADADFWMRIACRFPVAKVTGWLARYRYHDEQRDTQRARISRDWVGAVSELIASGSLNARERRHARMGIHLARYRYAAPTAWRERTAAVYAAALANPAGIFNSHFPKRDLLIGRAPIKAWLSRIKQRLGFRPRSG
jgi:glycosyltransferase involved in cell wall biosynthesis